ncbi:unnamed protein product [Rhodiola kirilowii]
MDGGGGGSGRRTSKCMDGFSDGRRDDSDINRILLKYRPIAPKPVVGGSSTGGGGSSTLSGKRTKRKYVRVSNRCKKKEGADTEEKRIVTLQLLPERSDPETERTSTAQLDIAVGRDSSDSDLRALEYMEMNSNDNNNFNFNININNWFPAVGGGRSRLIESWVTVESVTGTCTGTAEEDDNISSSHNQLETDSCPGFISKVENGRVEWVNTAYRRMVGCGSDVRAEVVVWVDIKAEAAAVLGRVIRGFSCWVKVQYYEDEVNRKRPLSMVVPCDAWRVENGGFAWRLDARAALCLGILTDNNGCH